MMTATIHKLQKRAIKSPTEATDHEICEQIDSGRWSFEQISEIALRSNARLMRMANQAVISDNARAIRSQLQGLNLAELHQVAEMAGMMAMVEVRVMQKPGKASGRVVAMRGQGAEPT